MPTLSWSWSQYHYPGCEIGANIILELEPTLSWSCSQHYHAAVANIILELEPTLLCSWSQHYTRDGAGSLDYP